MTRRLVPLAAAAALALAVVPALPAAAAVVTTVGHSTAPAQPFLNNPDASDWLGGYALDFEQVYSVRFALLDPDNDEPGAPATDLTTKWGAALPADVSRWIAYLLWRYGDTTDADEAAALAHLLHAWTSGPTNPAQLDPANGRSNIAYDAPFHLAKLPAATQQAVTDFQTEATTYADLWVGTLISPATSQVGVPGTWTFGVDTDVTATRLPDFPIHLEVTGGVFSGGVTTLDVETAADGSPVEVDVTPTAENVEVTMTYARLATTAQMVPSVDVATASWVRRADNFTTVDATIALIAAPAVTPAAPELPATGAEPALAALVAALVAVGLGAAVVLGRRRDMSVSERRRPPDVAIQGSSVGERVRPRRPRRPRGRRPAPRSCAAWPSRSPG